MPFLSCIPLLKLYRLTGVLDRGSGGSSPCLTFLTLPSSPSPLLCLAAAEQGCIGPPTRVPASHG